MSFDIGSHSYVKRAKKLIDEMFPLRHTLILGDSTKTLPEYCKQKENMLFDAAFIDGGHESLILS